jgi:hypothetical protein
MKGQGETESMVHWLIFFFATIIIVAILVWVAVTKFKILG